MAKATIKVYGKAIRGGYAEVISSEQFDEKVAERAKELYEDKDEFYEWLEDQFTVDEVWNMTEETKKAVKENQYKERCEMWALDDMEDEYEEFIITTEVDCPCDCHND